MKKSLFCFFEDILILSACHLRKSDHINLEKHGFQCVSLLDSSPTSHSSSRWCSKLEHFCRDLLRKLIDCRFFPSCVEKVQMLISRVSACRIRHQPSNFREYTQKNRVFRCRCPPKNHQTRFFSKKGVKAKCEEEYFRKTQFTLLYFSDLHKSFANLIHRILATRTFR